MYSGGSRALTGWRGVPRSQEFFQKMIDRFQTEFCRNILFPEELVRNVRVLQAPHPTETLGPQLIYNGLSFRTCNLLIRLGIYNNGDLDKCVPFEWTSHADFIGIYIIKYSRQTVYCTPVTTVVYTVNRSCLCVGDIPAYPTCTPTSASPHQYVH